MRQTRTAILHVGFHKTGTTAIQASLSSYDDGHTTYADLGDSNHSIFFQTLFEEDHFFGHWQRLGLSHAEHDRLVRDNYQTLKKQLQRNRNKFIFSGENISLLGPDSLRRVRAYFESYSFDVRIVVFVREPLSWTASVTQQWVRSGIIPGDPIKRGNPLKSHLRDRLDRFIHVFGRENVIIAKYEDADRSDHSGDIARYLAEILELRPGLIQTHQRSNSSMDEATLKILIALFDSGLVHDAGSMLQRVRLQFISHLQEILSAQGEQPIKITFFNPLVDWEDYREVNELIQEPYALSESEDVTRSWQALRNYLSTFNETAVKSSLHAALKGFHVCPPSNASLLELTTLLFYGVMRADAEEATRRQLEKVHRKRNKLGRARKMFDNIKATKPCSVRQSIFDMKRLIKRIVRRQA